MLLSDGKFLMYLVPRVGVAPTPTASKAGILSAKLTGPMVASMGNAPI